MLVEQRWGDYLRRPPHFRRPCPELSNMVNNLGHCIVNHKLEWNEIRAECFQMHNFQSYFSKFFWTPKDTFTPVTLIRKSLFYLKKHSPPPKSSLGYGPEIDVQHSLSYSKTSFKEIYSIYQTITYWSAV